MGGQTRLRIAVDSSEMNWTISENIFNEKKQIIGAKKLYRVRRGGNFLKVFRLLAGTSEEEPTELFSVDDRLFFSLGTPQIIFEIRDTLRDRGVEIREDQPLQTLSEGELWSFVGTLKGRELPFQVRLTGSHAMHAKSSLVLVQPHESLNTARAENRVFFSVKLSS